MDTIKSNLLYEIKKNIKIARLKETFMLGKYFFLINGIISFIIHWINSNSVSVALPYLIFIPTILIPCYKKESKLKYDEDNSMLSKVKRNMKLLIKLISFNFCTLIILKKLTVNSIKGDFIVHAIITIIIGVIILLINYFLFFTLNKNKYFNIEKQKMYNKIQKHSLFLYKCFMCEFDKFYDNQINKIEDIEDINLKMEFLNLAKYLNYTKTLKINAFVKELNIKDIQTFQLTNDKIELKKIIIMFNELNKLVQMSYLVLNVKEEDIR